MTVYFPYDVVEKLDCPGYEIFIGCPPNRAGWYMTVMNQERLAVLQYISHRATPRDVKRLVSRSIEKLEGAE